MLFPYATRLAHGLSYTLNGVKVIASTMTTFIVKKIGTVPQGVSDYTAHVSMTVRSPEFPSDIVDDGYHNEFLRGLVDHQRFNPGCLITGEVVVNGVKEIYRVVPVVDECG